MSRPLLELAETRPQEGYDQRAEAVLTDLRAYGAGVQYYAVKVQQLLVDGTDILDSAKPTVAILDTGTTGLVLPKPLFFAFDAVRRASAREVGIKRAGDVEVRLAPVPGSRSLVGPSLHLRRGRIQDLNASLDIVTPLAEDAGSVFLRAEMQDENSQSDRKIERPSTVFLGLGFFAGLRCLSACC